MYFFFFLYIVFKTIFILLFREQNETKFPPSIKSKPEKQNSESTEKTNQEENQLRKLSDTHNISKPLRPKSSRPPAPNRRPQSNTYTE